MSVSLEEIMHAAQARLVTLSCETAGHVMLSAVERFADLAGRVDRHGVTVSEAGDVQMVVGSSASPEDAERSVRRLLGELLASVPGSRPALQRIATSDVRGMPRFVAELEAALIPLNRAAARRALSRLHRDVARARSAGKLTAPSPLPEPSTTVVQVPPQATPVVESLAVEATPEESPPAPLWSVVVPVPSPLPGAFNPTEGTDATPFLGGWPAVEPRREPVRVEPEGASPAPVKDETTQPMFRRKDEARRAG